MAKMTFEQILEGGEKALQTLLSMVLREKSNFIFFHIANQLPLYHLFFTELQCQFSHTPNFHTKWVRL